MDVYDEKSASFQESKRLFASFLQDQSGQGDVYPARVASMLRAGETRLIVNIDDIRKQDPELANRVLRTPMQHLAPFQSALKEYVLTQDAHAAHDGEHKDGEDKEGSLPRKKNHQNYTIGLDGNLGANKVSPRQLQAQHLGQLVCVEGIATRCSIVRPKVSKTVHYCEKTSVHSEMVYHDSTSITGFPTSSIYPTKDLDGNPLTTEFGLCSYADHQTLVIQEMPERAPAGLLPSSIDVVLDDDLVDQCKPGDRVAIIGIYRALPSKSQGSTSGLFKSVLIANHVRHLGKSLGVTGTITPTDIKNIREISARKDVFELLGRSVAPSIFGHDFIKRALVLLLLGGVEKNLENGTHIRGDINMLFVGDPSTAKSQLLRFILNIAPLALNTTGRGSSGVGLTAAVTTDKETGERRLEAGAMVLADRGVVCIDEFDKMSDGDRVAIHEVMEQQTVTIAKAGIHMSLNARCSVVAAANPRYSQYDSTKPANWNVNLPDSLLSRFDFMFIILDTPEAEHDRAVADKVLSNHRYQRKAGGGPAEDDEDAEIDYNAQLKQGDSAGAVEQPDSVVFQKFDKLLHAGLIKSRQAAGAAAGRRGASAKEAQSALDILSIPFMKKYLEYAKVKEPLLTPEAAEYIGAEYAGIRTKMSEDAKRESGHPITARTLETIIRLATAHAKARLDSEVTIEDCKQVVTILKYALDHDTGVKAKDAAAAAAAASVDNMADEDESSGGDDDEDNDGADEAPAASAPASASKSRRTAGAKKKRQDDDDDAAQDDDDASAAGSKARSPSKRQKGTAGTPVKRSAGAAAKKPKAKTAPASGSSTGSRLVRTTADMIDEDEEEEKTPAPRAVAAAASKPAASRLPAVSSTSPRYLVLQKQCVALFKKLRQDELTLKALLAALEDDESIDDPYSEEEAASILSTMEKQNQIMFRNGMIYKI